MKKIIMLLSSMMLALSASAETAVNVCDNVQVKPELAPESAAVAVAEVIPNNDELTPTEKLKAYRNKLEEKNLLLLQKKMEMIRLEQEMALLRTLERSMDQTLNAINKL